MRSLVGNPQVAREYYANLLKNGGGLSIEERYGKAVADINATNPAAAIPDLQGLLREYPKVTQFYGALGQAYLANGQLKESQAVLEQAPRLFPAQRADYHSPGGNVDARRRQQARAADPGRSVQSGRADARSNQAHRQGRQCRRQRCRLVLLHGGLLSDERRSA